MLELSSNGFCRPLIRMPRTVDGAQGIIFADEQYSVIDITVTEEFELTIAQATVCKLAI